VVLEADEEFAWLATGLIGCEPDASGLYALESTNADALVELALMHGPRIRLVAPPDLRRRVVEEASLLGRGGWERPQADEAARSVEGEADVSSGPRPRSRRDDATSRLRRFMFIVAYLSRHPDARLDRLCSILEVDEAVLLSDLERLSVCGVYPSTDFRLFDVAVDPERGRVHFRRNPVPGLERPVRLTRREVMALLLGFKLVSDGIAPPFDWTADRVMEEVLGLAGQDLADAVRELEKRVRLGSHHDLSWDTFYEVSMGVCNRRCVEIEYYTQSRDAMSRRTVRPFVLVCTLGRWYLLGHCEWRQEVRTFRVDRIRSARLLGRGFEPPADFDPGRHLGAGIYSDPDPAGDRRVVAEFEPAFLARSRGRESMELLRASRDGVVTFSVHPDRYEGFLTWLISHTTRFRIVHPEELGRCAERRRSRILSAYD
jgi:proteasome accessory factor C